MADNKDRQIRNNVSETTVTREGERLGAAFEAVRGEDTATLESAPERTAAGRIDQADAARHPRLSWQALDGAE